MADIDNLYIQINANAVKANDAIDKLSAKLGTLSTALSGLNGSSLTNLSVGVRNFANATASITPASITNLSAVTRNLKALGKLNYNGITQLTNALRGLTTLASSLPASSQNITRLVRAITQLSKASTGQVITNIPLLATAIHGLVTTISSAPAVSQNVINLTTAIASLSRAVTGQVISNIPLLATALRGLFQTLSTAPQINTSIISMTASLASLASAGSATGTAAHSLTTTFSSLSTSTLKSTKSFSGLASVIGKVYATYWMLFRAFGYISKAIDLSSKLTEVENVVNHTFGAMRTKLDDFVENSIDQFGMGELAAKQYASRFQAMGVAMGISNNAVAESSAFLSEKLKGNEDAYDSLGDTMADMSINLTKLTSDYASFFDVSQSDVAEDFQSIFTGTTKPLRQYGIDLTAANLKQFALNNGLNANIATMTQAEKAMLRYQYVMANSGHVMGDFARTADTWHNVITRLKNNFVMLGTTIGDAFIHLLKPVAVGINNSIVAINKFAIAVSNALGKLLGWEYEESSGGFTQDYEDAADAADDLASGTKKATDQAKKLKIQLQGIDELNNLTTNNDDDGGGGRGNGTADAYNLGNVAEAGSWVKKNTPHDSDIDTWRKLGNTIRDAIQGILDIDWNTVYQKMSKFGENLAEFLNGLFEPDKNGLTVLGSVGEAIAGALNSALSFLNSFGSTFDFKAFGYSIADGINRFFENFDFAKLADTINLWVHGIEEAIISALDNINIEDIISGLTEFFTNLDLDVIAIAIGGFLLKYQGKEIAIKALGGLLSTEIATGLGTGTISLANALGISFVVGAFSFKIGNYLYENCQTIQDIADKIAEWLTDDGKGIRIDKLIPITLGGIAFSFGAVKIGALLSKALTSSIALSPTVGAFKALMTTIVSQIGTFITGTAIPAITGFFSTIGTAVLSALGTAVTVVASAVAGWNIGQKLYELIFGEEIGMSFKEQIGEIASSFTDGTILQAVIMMWADIRNKFFEGATNAVSTLKTIPTQFNTKVITPVSKLFSSLGTKISGFFSTAWNVIKAVWYAVPKMFKDNIISPVVKNFETIGLKIPNFFSDAWTLITSVWNAVPTWFNDTVISPVKRFFTDLKDGIASALNGAWDTVSGTWENVATWFEGKFKAVLNTLTGKNGLKDKLIDGFKQAYNGITKIFDAIGSYFKGIANSIITPIGKAINGIINGINWVLVKVGSKTQLGTWNIPQFARGTNGLPRDTIGMVNDQKGSTYREMIVPPNGRPFIPEGRNVVLPMAKGTKIMPANETKRFVGNIPHFEGGIGEFFNNVTENVKSFTGDVLDYIAEPAKIMSVAVGKFVDLSGVGGAVKSIAEGAVSTVFSSSVDYIKKIFDTVGSAKVENAVKWAVDIANNNIHGYDQGSRWGTPDYDCSSLVISAFEQAGIKLKSSGATYTGNMYGAAMQNGFKDVKSKVNVLTGTGMKRGDILLNRQHHVALYLGNGMIVQASANEHGGARGGTPGDQTGREIATRAYYNFPWDNILRYSKFQRGIGRIIPTNFIGTFATGGFPEDGWFRASNNEIMGRFDNGKSVVANNEQITKGISDAVQAGNREMLTYVQQQNQLLRQQNDYLYDLVQKETGISYQDIFKATQRGANEYKIANGRPPFL